MILSIALAFSAGLVAGATAMALRRQRFTSSCESEPMETPPSASWTAPSMPSTVMTDGESVAEVLEDYLVADEAPIVLNGRHRAVVKRLIRDRNRAALDALGRSV